MSKDLRWRDGAILEPRDLKPLMSQYVAAGHSDEQHNLTRIVARDGFLEASLFASEIGPYEKHGFNLSSMVVTQWVFQLGVIYAGLDRGHSRKAGPVWLREFSIRCRERVVTRSWNCCITVHSTRSLPGLTLYRGSFKVCEGQMQGRAIVAAAVPLDGGRAVVPAGASGRSGHDVAADPHSPTLS